MAVVGCAGRRKPLNHEQHLYLGATPRDPTRIQKSLLMRVVGKFEYRSGKLIALPVPGAWQSPFLVSA